MHIPYGYQMENNEFIICQEKAEVVRMIFDYYLSGASLGKVADMLSEKTIMPRGWHHDKWNHCKMIGIEYLPTTTYTVINGKDRFFFGPLARRKN